MLIDGNADLQDGVVSNMRDPERIDKLLTELKYYWKRYPDLRLCQVVGNFLHDSHAEQQLTGAGYNTEDDEFYKYLITLNEPK